jgi:predicted RNase H-like HicB family nuclease
VYYIALVTEEEGRYCIDFPSCPGCCTFIEGDGDLQETASEALEGWLEASIAASYVISLGYNNYYVEEGIYELPSKGCSALIPIAISSDVAAKVVVYKITKDNLNIAKDF